MAKKKVTKKTTTKKASAKEKVVEKKEVVGTNPNIQEVPYVKRKTIYNTK